MGERLSPYTFAALYGTSKVLIWSLGRVTYTRLV